MAHLPADPILLRDLPNDAMYVGREWWEFYVGEKRKLDGLNASLRAIIRDVEAGNIDSLGRLLAALRELP